MRVAPRLIQTPLARPTSSGAFGQFCAVATLVGLCGGLGRQGIPRLGRPCTNATVFVDRMLFGAELFLARHALRAEFQRCRVNQMAGAVKSIARILADEIDAFKEGRS